MQINTIMVIGAGQMGSGIAQVAAQSGYSVLLNDLEQKFIDRGMSVIEKNLSRLVKKERLSEADKEDIMDRLQGTTSMEDAAKADLVIEAAVENLEVKTNIFRQLDEICAPETILATNTSSLSITQIAAATKRPDRVIGMHFMNPVPVMKLVEVIRGLATADEVFEVIKETSEKMGKTPVEVNDFPGFALNRILIPMINEAIYAVYEGVATPEAVDKVMTLGANQPMGPLALADLIGLDTCLAIMEVLHEGFGDSKYRPCPLLRQYVQSGRLGRKTGQGFYNYE
ncbi:MAG: 3-hydroxybutyryl-CoA dehydrogenase [Thermoanaerobacteraceae bacterium]|nr:3-hydroxybutyryl-CoA dehydrogenase [Thermoanaerobacteraceae bacterium]